MARPLVFPDEFKAELRRHGLMETPLRLGEYTFWKSKDGKFYSTIKNYRGAVPIEILLETLARCGLEYREPSQSPDGLAPAPRRRIGDSPPERAGCLGSPAG
jgi:hypothetical protein